MKRSFFLRLIGMFFLSFYMFSCDNDLHVTMPQGPEGPAGKSAYEIWVQEVENGNIDWPKDRIETEHFFLYLKGKDGKDGQDGLNAYEVWVQEVEKGIKDPHNPNKEWDKNKTDKNDFWYFLTGADGKDGSTPQIGDNGNWWIDGKDTGLPSRGADGKDGTKITISKDNTWVIDGKDTGIPLTGADGKDGKEVYIGDNGNWFIDGKDTTIPARGIDGVNGLDGTNGIDGKSAYEVWVIEVMNGLKDPHNLGQNWDKSKISLDDFWYYLQGKTGADGRDGQNGQNGSIVTAGDNGNWFIDGVDTGKPWKGENGKNGSIPEIGDNGNWWIDGQDTGKPALGKDGQNGQDGINGTDGRTPSVEIGDNGNWWIDGQDTGKPAFGEDGNNGQDGNNGLSAYELWKLEAEAGTLDDPKHPGQKWPQNKTTVQNFWEYLKGMDGQDGASGQNGQSAYELWKEKVAEGLLNPHDEEGGNWPQDKISVQDFWEYLRGKDGKDGSDGEDGETIIKGKPNVIAEYFNATLKEYVNVADGSVLFKVYDDKGDPSPNAEVTDIPGIPGKKYIADANGSFVIPKGDLPQDLSETDRTGTCTVRYTKSTGAIVTETSAPNSYVPNRIYVRITVNDVPYLGWDKPQTAYEWEYSTVNVKFLVERRSGLSGNWEALPIGLGSLDQDIIAYELSDPDNPLSYSTSSKKLSTIKLDISKAGEIKVNRPTKNASYLSLAWQDKYLNPWDGNDHYFNVILESYYGESPHANVIVKLAPVQIMPLVKNLKGKDPQALFLSEVTGEFDLSEIDYSLFFNKNYLKSGINYSPTLMSKADAEKEKTFFIVFSKDGNAANNSTNIGTLANPGFRVLVPFFDSGVGFQSRTHLFHGFGWMGNLRNNNGLYYIESDKWHGTELPDITITIVP